jgi:hypothetical protein
VQAQTSYSNASLTGTYTITMIAGSAGAVSSPVPFMGTLVFDGNGNITSGNITGASFPPAGNPGTTTDCPITATGTYTLANNATGTASLTLAGASVSSTATGNETTSNGCLTVAPQLSLSIAAAQQGQMFTFQPAAGTTRAGLSGSGFKQ